MTPILDHCGVAGTLRAALIDAQLVTPAQLALDDVAAVDRLWLANSVQGCGRSMTYGRLKANAYVAGSPLSQIPCKQWRTH